MRGVIPEVLSGKSQASEAARGRSNCKIVKPFVRLPPTITTLFVHPVVCVSGHTAKLLEKNDGGFLA